MGRILSRDNLRELIRLVRELDEERRQQAARILLASVPEIKVKKGKCGVRDMVWTSSMIVELVRKNEHA